MGNNGQQLVVELPTTTQVGAKVRISGTNQNNQKVQWDGLVEVLAQPRQVAGLGLIGACTYNWWWKGNADIWYSDSAGNTQYLSTNVPVSQSSDYYLVPAPGFVGHAVKPPPGKH